jgi:pyruvate dehydrogenase E2 component (dihydrolipoamide acetyltransferase)
MADIVIMPKLGFDMAEGTLVRWVVAEGDALEKGAVLAEIETDKATVEVESGYSGVVKRHLVAQGTVVPVNTPIAVIGGADEEIDYGQLIGEIAPEGPAAPAAEAPGQGKAAEAQAVAVDTRPIRREEPVVEMPHVEEGKLPEGVRASPLARRLAEERGIDLGKVKGSGPRGRIIQADIEAYQETRPVEEVRVPGGIPAAVPSAVGEAHQDRRVPLSRLRGAIGRRMAQAKQQTPHFYITREYDMRALMDLRARVNALLPEEEKTSVNDYVIKAAALTLSEFPNLNAALDEQKGEVVQFGHINIGVAVAVENGLLTVVCRDTDRKTVHQISVEVRGLVKRAREGKVRPDDIEGSTFSVSNLGMYGVEHFIAIINPPEAAILALGAVLDVPVVENGEIKAGKRMKATISVDHRVSDGAEAARFLQALAKFLEEPLRLML